MNSYQKEASLLDKIKALQLENRNLKAESA
jgi:hypothetical protein